MIDPDRMAVWYGVTKWKSLVASCKKKKETSQKVPYRISFSQKNKIGAQDGIYMHRRPVVKLRQYFYPFYPKTSSSNNKNTSELNASNALFLSNSYSIIYTVSNSLQYYEKKDHCQVQYVGQVGRAEVSLPTCHHSFNYVHMIAIQIWKL